MAIKNRKMKLTAIRNTIDGEDVIGCRASGIYNGHYIERTNWQPLRTLGLDPNSMHHLELLSTGQYRKAIREIDEYELG